MEHRPDIFKWLYIHHVLPVVLRLLLHWDVTLVLAEEVLIRL